MANKAPSLDELNRQRAYISSWPAASGQLDKVEIAVSYSSGFSRYSGSHYIVTVARVEYRYTVDGRPYTGDTLRKWSLTERDPYAALKRSEDLLAPYLEPFRPPDIAYQIIAKVSEENISNKTFTFYPKRPISVHCDPQNPSSSTLENNLEPLTTRDYHPGQNAVFSTLIGSAFSMTGLYLLVRRFIG